MTSPTYDLDCVPSAWDTEQRKGLERDQTPIPDEFYTTTQLPMITPDNALDFVHIWKQMQVAIRPLFLALFSGSPRLTLQA